MRVNILSSTLVYVTYLGYPTPVNPDQPMYVPLGKWWMRSSALASFFRYDGRRTRLFNRAEADMMEEGRGSKLGKKMEGDLGV